MHCSISSMHDHDEYLCRADFWEMRDIKGQLVNIDYPFFQHQESAQRLQQRLPIPVHCCWNGLVALTASIFSTGLRMRTHMEGECAASECSLFCDDIHRLGYRNVIVDPSVRVAYHMSDFMYIHDTQHQVKPGYMLYTTIANNGTSGLMDDCWQPANQTMCCPLPAGRDQLDWGNSGCHNVDIFAVNYTHAHTQEAY